MKRKNKIVLVVIIMTSLFAQSAVARLQKDARACIKPRFSKFTPAHLSEVAPGSTVSFVTNYSTGKASIKVTVKDIKIKKIKVIDKKSFYVVEFELPESVKGTYARVHIKARAKIGSSTCEHRDGWLLKISGDQSADGAESKAKQVVAKKLEIEKKQANVEAATEPGTNAATKIIDAAVSKPEPAEAGAATDK